MATFIEASKVVFSRTLKDVEEPEPGSPGGGAYPSGNVMLRYGRPR